MGYPPTLEEYNELINKVKLLEQKNEQKKNDDTVYTMFKDKKMEFMIFATGNIYRETGTASKEIEDKTFSMMIQRERTRSMDQSNQQSNSRKNEIQSVQNPLHNTNIKK